MGEETLNQPAANRAQRDDKAAASAMKTAPPPSAAEAPSAHKSASEVRMTREERDARVVAEVVIPAALSSILSIPEVGPLGVKAYMEKFVMDAGVARDPVERVLLEQLVLAHHRLARLHARAAEATHTDAIRVLNAAAIRLLGEVRRTALAIRTYRLPPGTKSFSVVHQQNVVAAGEQKVTYVDQSADQKKVSLQCRSELDGSAPGGHDDERNDQHPESAPRRRWAAERSETASLD